MCHLFQTSKITFNWLSQVIRIKAFKISANETLVAGGNEYKLMIMMPWGNYLLDSFNKLSIEFLVSIKK